MMLYDFWKLIIVTSLLCACVQAADENYSPTDSGMPLNLRVRTDAPMMEDEPPELFSPQRRFVVNGVGGRKPSKSFYDYGAPVIPLSPSRSAYQPNAFCGSRPDTPDFSRSKQSKQNFQDAVRQTQQSAENFKEQQQDPWRSQAPQQNQEALMNAVRGDQSYHEQPPREYDNPTIYDRQMSYTAHDEDVENPRAPADVYPAQTGRQQPTPPSRRKTTQSVTSGTHSRRPSRPSPLNQRPSLQSPPSPTKISIYGSLYPQDPNSIADGGYEGLPQQHQLPQSGAAPGFSNPGSRIASRHQSGTDTLLAAEAWRVYGPCSNTPSMRNSPANTKKTSRPASIQRVPEELIQIQQQLQQNGQMLYDEDEQREPEQAPRAAPYSHSKITDLFSNTDREHSAMWLNSYALPPCEVAYSINSGSIVCFGGEGWLSGLIRCCSEQWRDNKLGISHVGMVLVATPNEMEAVIEDCADKQGLQMLKNKQELVRYMLDEMKKQFGKKGNAKRDRNTLFLLHATGKYGAHIVPLQRYVSAYRGNVFLRNLENPIPMVDLLQGIYCNLGKPYNHNFWRMLRAVNAGNADDEEHTMFCSQLVASMLMYAKFPVRDGTLTINVTPAQFTSTYGGRVGEEEHSILSGLAKREVALKLFVRY